MRWQPVRTLTRALTGEPVAAFPTCDHCHHGWHGLPCPAGACNCPSAFQPTGDNT